MYMHKLEKIWLIFGISTLFIFLLTVGISAFHMGHKPPSSIVTIDPARVDQTPPFDKPGLIKINDHEYRLIIAAQMFSFTQKKIEIPKGSTVHIIATTKDVVHGFEIAGTNVNMMLEPGYVSEYTQKFNKAGHFLAVCNEYCGPGHHLMFTSIEVIDK